MPKYRGRLIFPFKAVIARLDTVETRIDPDGAGSLSSGYDDDFREPTLHTESGARVDDRKETLVEVPCQYEDRTFENLQMMPAGDSPTTNILLTMHFCDLERLGLVDPVTGVARIHKNDRLVEIMETCSGDRVQEYRNPPGVFVTQAVPAGLGIGLKRNLLLVTFQSREQSVRGVTG